MQTLPPSEVLFQVICKGSNMALSIENSENPHKSRITGVQSNPQELCQLWYIAKVSTGLEITNAVSDLGFQEMAGEIHLFREKRKKVLEYQLEEVRIGKELYYVFKNTLKNNYVASLEGILKSKTHDQDDERQLFKLQPCLNNDIINLTTMIVHPSMNMAINVPDSRKEPGLKLTLEEKQGRLNQRWILVQVFNNYIIKNFKTGLVLDVKSEALKNVIIQSKRTNSLNEVWIIERVVDNYYYIKSLNMPEYFLGIEDQRLGIIKKGFKWRLEGFEP